MRKILFLMIAGFTAVLVLQTLETTEASANGGVQSSWLSTYPNACQTLQTEASKCSNSICHNAVPNLNPYGQSIQSNGVDVVAAEGDDADGDGRTNIQEINDCTLPGDPSSVLPTYDSTWSVLKALFNSSSDGPPSGSGR